MMEKGPTYSTENCIQYSMKNQDGKRKKTMMEKKRKKKNGEGNGTLLQYSCLENPMGRGTW